MVVTVDEVLHRLVRNLFDFPHEDAGGLGIQRIRRDHTVVRDDENITVIKEAKGVNPFRDLGCLERFHAGGKLAQRWMIEQLEPSQSAQKKSRK